MDILLKSLKHTQVAKMCVLCGSLVKYGSQYVGYQEKGPHKFDNPIHWDLNSRVNLSRVDLPMPLQLFSFSTPSKSVDEGNLALPSIRSK